MSRPWYAQYPDDYERKTSHLTMVQHGAYRLLLDQYYKTGNPLAPDVPTLQRICRAYSVTEKQAISSVLAEFFTLEADGWHNKRADEELQKANEISTKRAQSANKRYCKDGANAPAIAEQVHTHSTATATATKIKKEKEAQAPRELPNWLPLDAWEGFVEMRKKQRKPLTERAQCMAISKLEKLMAKGHDPTEVLNQSTLNCWQDLWPIKAETRIETRISPNVRPNKFDAIFEGVAEFVRGNSEETSGLGTGATGSDADGSQDYAGSTRSPAGAVGTGLCVVSSNGRPSAAEVPSLLRRPQIIDGGRRSHSDPDVFESSA